MRETLVIGIGNAYRSDDGAGLAAMRALQAKRLPGVQFLACAGDGTALIDAWQTGRNVILIDAVASGARAGTTYRFDALAEQIPLSCSFHSTHAFGIAEALELARALECLPPSLLVYGIEGQNFMSGVGLAPPVQEAIQEVVEQITREVLNSAKL